MVAELLRKFEAASRDYAAAHGIERDADWFVLKLQEEMGEVTQAWNRLSGRARDKGQSAAELRRSLADETADLFGHILLLAHHQAIDLEAAVERKWGFTPKG